MIGSYMWVILRKGSDMGVDNFIGMIMITTRESMRWGRRMGLGSWYVVISSIQACSEMDRW